MKKLKLGAQLNISFALALFVPMIIATVFSIMYYSKKIENEVVNKISSDLKTANIIYRGSLMEMKNLAFAYAQKDWHPNQSSIDRPTRSFVDPPTRSPQKPPCF